MRFRDALLVQRQQFLPVNGHIARRLDAQTDLAPIDVNDRDTDIVADENLLPEFPAEYEHVASLLRRAWPGSRDGPMRSARSILRYDDTLMRDVRLIFWTDSDNPLT